MAKKGEIVRKTEKMADIALVLTYGRPYGVNLRFDICSNIW